MPTSSLVAIARLLQNKRMTGMSAALSLALPVSARTLIARASFRFLAGWQLATNSSISVDEKNGAWHAGHVEDAFPLSDGRVLLASHTGGVWLAATDRSFAAIPLSNGWRNVDMHCVNASSPDAVHIYAGGNGALFEALPSALALARRKGSKSLKTIASGFGMGSPVSVRALLRRVPDTSVFNWREITTLDTTGAAISLNIRKLVVVSDTAIPKLVVAADQGLFWSDLPGYGQGYRFAQAVGIPQAQCLAVVLSRVGNGPQTVVCSPTGSASTPQTNGLYFGTWQNGNLTMTRATHNGNVDFVQWQFGVVNVSHGFRNVLYAAISAGALATLSLRAAFRAAAIKTPPFKLTTLVQRANLPLPNRLSTIIRTVNPPRQADALYAVLSSSDGGATWAPVGPSHTVQDSILLPRDPGLTQGGWNLSITVSPADPNTIALGWRIGPWIGRSTPFAFTWEEHGDKQDRPGFSPHIHSDSHGLHFDPHDPTGKSLLVCSDGGFIFSRDLCATFDSSVNQGLPNLQFQSYPGQSGGSNGASGASPHTPGLMVGSLQDNGVVYSFLANGNQSPWRKIIGGDGIVSFVLANDRFLYWSNSDPPAPQIAKWNGTQPDAPVNVPVRTPSPSVPAGKFFSNPFGEPVQSPTYSKNGQPMLAVAAYDASGNYSEVWGLFADSDGSNAVWDFLAAVNPSVDGGVLAAESANGNTVLIGTALGHIFSYDSPSNVLTPITIDPAVVAPSGPVLQFSFLAGGVAIARFAGGLLRFDPGRNLWTTMGGNGLPNQEGSMMFMAVDTATNILYLGTDFGIHATWDAGDNWLPVSQGLPLHCHPATLRFAADANGTRSLYLFTYGRSAWKATLN